MAEWLRRVKVSQGALAQFQMGAETFCSPSAILHGTEPVSALTLSLCILLLSLCVFFSWILSVAIQLGQGFNSEHEHPTSTVLEHLPLGDFESGPGPGLDYMCWPAAVLHGHDYSNCRASEQKSHKSAWTSFFLELLKIIEKQSTHYWVFQPLSP